MAMASQQQYQEMIHILSSIMSNNNQARQEADAYFQSCMTNNTISTTACLLSVLGNQAERLECRSLAGILLRGTFDENSLSGKRNQFSDENIIMFRSEIVKSWLHETNSVILRRLSHIIAQLAFGGKWVDLLPYVIENVSTSNENSIVSTLNLIEVLSEYCPDDICTHCRRLQAFLGALIASPSLKVQVACALAIGACINAVDEEASRDSFTAAVEPIITVLANALNSGDESGATAIMEHLVSIAEVQPLFFKTSMDTIVSAMLTVAGSTGLEFSTRSMALELMVTLGETAPVMARRCPGLLKGLIPLAMTLMLEVEDTEEEWVTGSYTDEPIEENYYIGEEAIERSAFGIGGKLIAPPVLGFVQQYMANPNPPVS